MLGGNLRERTWRIVRRGCGTRFAVPMTLDAYVDFQKWWSLFMDATPQILVTLSEDLLKKLRREAETRHVPLRWLVAGLVCDTLDQDTPPAEPRAAARVSA